MQPSLRCEVHYAEAEKDLRNVWHKWHNNQTAGTWAFIPDVNDRDECFIVLCIFSCAVEEANAIPTE